MTTSQTEICHFFKKHGWCRFKDKCKFKHVGLPAESRQNSTNSSQPTRYQGTCDHCGEQGHKKQECFRLIAEQTRHGSNGQYDNDSKRNQTAYLEVEEDFETTFVLETTYNDGCTSKNPPDLNVDNGRE